MTDADLTLVVLDVSRALEQEDRTPIERAQGKRLVAGNKCDLGIVNRKALPVSALTGEGIAELRRAILDTLAARGQIEQEGGFITSLRHEQLLRKSQEALEQARRETEVGIPH
jgi:tRNA modification GTPase